MHGAHVGVFHQADKVSLGSLLKSEDGGALEAKVLANAGGNFAHKALERQFSDQQISALLVSPDVAEGYRARAVSMRSFSGSRHSGAGGLCNQLSSRRLPSSRRLSRGLFCASHVDFGVGFWWRPEWQVGGEGGWGLGGGEMGRFFFLVLIHSPPEAPPLPLIIPASNAAPVARHGSRLRASDGN